MRTYPEAEKIFDEVMNRIGDLDPHEGLDVLLHYFLGAVHGMEMQVARRMRDELNGRFGGRHCSQQVCSMMVELLNGHLAGRKPASAAGSLRHV